MNWLPGMTAYSKRGTRHKIRDVWPGGQAWTRCGAEAGDFTTAVPRQGGTECARCFRLTAVSHA